MAVLATGEFYTQTCTACDERDNKKTATKPKFIPSFKTHFLRPRLYTPTGEVGQAPAESGKPRQCPAFSGQMIGRVEENGGPTWT